MRLSDVYIESATAIPSLMECLSRRIRAFCFHSAEEKAESFRHLPCSCFLFYAVEKVSVARDCETNHQTCFLSFQKKICASGSFSLRRRTRIPLRGLSAFGKGCAALPP